MCYKFILLLCTFTIVYTKNTTSFKCRKDDSGKFSDGIKGIMTNNDIYKRQNLMFDNELVPEIINQHSSLITKSDNKSDEKMSNASHDNQLPNNRNTDKKENQSVFQNIAQFIVIMVFIIVFLIFIATSYRFRVKNTLNISEINSVKRMALQRSLNSKFKYPKKDYPDRFIV